MWDTGWVRWCNIRFMVTMASSLDEIQYARYCGLYDICTYMCYVVYMLFSVITYECDCNCIIYACMYWHYRCYYYRLLKYGSSTIIQALNQYACVCLPSVWEYLYCICMYICNKICEVWRRGCLFLRTLFLVLRALVLWFYFSGSNVKYTVLPQIMVQPLFLFSNFHPGH